MHITAATALHLAKPLLHGDAVKHFQRSLNTRLQRRHQKLRVHVDSQYGPLSAHAAARTLWLMGAPAKVYRSAQPEHGGHVIPAVRQIIEHPDQYWPRAWKVRAALRKHRKPKPHPPTVMYDAVTIANIPRDAQAVAGYIGGSFPTFQHLDEAFPHARRVSIAVASRFDADVLDVEPGDAPPDLAVPWVKRQHERGNKSPAVYTSVSGAQHLVDLLASHGIHRNSYRLWTAHYTFKPHLCSPSCGFGFRGHADATQWTDKSHDRSLDESLCAASWWGE